jgi:hypothetical protein
VDQGCAVAGLFVTFAGAATVQVMPTSLREPVLTGTQHVDRRGAASAALGRSARRLT